MLGGNIQDIQERLENDIMALNQMNAMRFVTPFKSIVVEKITQLSETADIIEMAQSSNSLDQSCICIHWW
jgi:hypothetical protein